MVLHITMVIHIVSPGTLFGSYQYPSMYRQASLCEPFIQIFLDEPSRIVSSELSCFAFCSIFQHLPCIVYHSATARIAATFAMLHRSAEECICLFCWFVWMMMSSAVAGSRKEVLMGVGGWMRRSRPPLDIGDDSQSSPGSMDGWMNLWDPCSYCSAFLMVVVVVMKIMFLFLA